MKLTAFSALFLFLASGSAHSHEARRAMHKRQMIASSSTSTSVVAASSSSTTTPTASSASAAAVSGVPAALATISLPAPAEPGVPSLTAITSGMPTPTSLPVTATYTAGATPPVSGAPALPTPFVFNSADWPAQDKLPDTTTPQVQAWLQELDGWDIPDFSPTINASCSLDPTAASQAEERHWWTCGGWTSPIDIVDCPTKETWGVSFDDGPSPYTQNLLEFLSNESISATFFVVGSRVIERPDVLVEEYMGGHEVSVHTWSHPYLTTLTNEQIVAELGWTRLAIKTVLGVTPTTFRPPYGDIDDRVRAIALAMGMFPIIWTRSPDGTQFDTNDWKVPGGIVTGPQSFETFEAILQNSTQLSTGFVVLEHDLYPQTVDLAIGYTLPAALAFKPTLILEPIGKCNSIPESNMYLESNTNKSFPFPNITSVATNGTSVSSNGSSSLNPTSGQSGNSTSGAPAAVEFPLVSAAVAASLFAAGLYLG